MTAREYKACEEANKRLLTAQRIFNALAARKIENANAVRQLELNAAGAPGPSATKPLYDPLAPEEIIEAETYDSPRFDEIARSNRDIRK